jgi:hypothetical protein
MLPVLENILGSFGGRRALPEARNEAQPLIPSKVETASP